jgi:hypothetical protein
MGFRNLYFNNNNKKKKQNKTSRHFFKFLEFGNKWLCGDRPGSQVVGFTWRSLGGEGASRP